MASSALNVMFSFKAFLVLHAITEKTWYENDHDHFLSGFLEQCIANVVMRNLTQQVSFKDHSQYDFLGPVTATMENGCEYDLFEDGEDKQKVRKQKVRNGHGNEFVDHSDVFIIGVNHVDCSVNQEGCGHVERSRETASKRAIRSLQETAAAGDDEKNTDTGSTDTTDDGYPDTATEETDEASADEASAYYAEGDEAYTGTDNAVNATLVINVMPFSLGFSDGEAGLEAIISILEHVVHEDALSEEIHARVQYLIAGKDPFGGACVSPSASRRMLEKDRSKYMNLDEAQKKRLTDSFGGIDGNPFVAYSIGIGAVVHPDTHGGTYAPIAHPTKKPTPVTLETVAPTKPLDNNAASLDDFKSSFMKLDTASKAGIAVGVLVILGCCIGTFCYYRKKKAKTEEEEEEDEESRQKRIEMIENTRSNVRMSFQMAQEYAQPQQGYDQYQGQPPATTLTEEEQLRQYEMRESEMIAEQQFQEEQARYEQQMVEYERAKAAYEQQQRELQYEQSTFNPMISDQKARRGSQLEFLQQQINSTKAQEDQLAEALALIEAKEVALRQQEERLHSQKAEWESMRQGNGPVGSTYEDMAKVQAYQEEVVKVAQQQQEDIYLKQQELYQQQLAQQQYAEQLAAYQAQLEEFQAQQSAEAQDLERHVEQEVHRRMSMGGGLGYLQADDPTEIHEQYQYQLSLAEQQLEALRFEKEQFSQVLEGQSAVMLEKQQVSFLREKEDFMKQIAEQQQALHLQVSFRSPTPFSAPPPLTLSLPAHSPSFTP